VAIAEKAKELRVETRYFKEGQQVAIFDPADSLDSKCRNPLLLL
jgi:type IV secretory pathway TraG/TraD family ATPase VirD4